MDARQEPPESMGKYLAREGVRACAAGRERAVLAPNRFERRGDGVKPDIGVHHHARHHLQRRDALLDPESQSQASNIWISARNTLDTRCFAYKILVFWNIKSRSLSVLGIKRDQDTRVGHGPWSHGSAVGAS